MVLLKTLLNPTLKLLLALPMTRRVLARLTDWKDKVFGTAEATNNSYAETCKAAFQVQEDLIKVMVPLLVVAVFGTAFSCCSWGSDWCGVRGSCAVVAAHTASGLVVDVLCGVLVLS